MKVAERAVDRLVPPGTGTSRSSACAVVTCPVDVGDLERDVIDPLAVSRQEPGPAAVG